MQRLLGWRRILMKVWRWRTGNWWCYRLPRTSSGALDRSAWGIHPFRPNIWRGTLYTNTEYTIKLFSIAQGVEISNNSGINRHYLLSLCVHLQAIYHNLQNVQYLYHRNIFYETDVSITTHSHKVSQKQFQIQESHGIYRENKPIAQVWISLEHQSSQ